MDRSEFWSLIGDARTKSNGDCDRLVELLEGRLGRLPAEEIIAFQTIIDELLAQSYTWELWAAGYLINGGCSDDMFDYFRAWLISQGEGIFTDALRDPETLADYPDEFPEEVECEAFLYVAVQAYQKKTGQEIYSRLPDSMPVTEPRGTRWEEEAVETLFGYLLVSHRRTDLAPLIYGFRVYVLPYLSAAERERLREKVRSVLDPGSWQGIGQSSPRAAFHLGACLGCHDEMAALVESWPDDLYAADTWGLDFFHRPQEIVLGLGDPRRVEAEMRRLRLELKLPHYVRAWLAHTEDRALDWVRDSILAVPNCLLFDRGLARADTHRELAERLTDALALVRAPEAAAPMLELMTSLTRTSGTARIG